MGKEKNKNKSITLPLIHGQTEAIGWLLRECTL